MHSSYPRVKVVVATILAAYGCSGSLAAAQKDDLSEPQTQTSIRRWVRELDDDMFSVRESATRSLSTAGTAAIDEVTDAAQESSAEVRYRAIIILESLSTSQDLKTASSAIEALKKLAKSDNPSASRLAKQALESHLQSLVEKLKERGAGVSSESGIIQSVYFSGAKVKDDDLKILSIVPDITSLSVSGTKIGDEGMVYVKGLKKLERLNLYQSQVGDDGLKHLKDLTNLTTTVRLKVE